jgi:hypothetical protein
MIHFAAPSEIGKGYASRTKVNGKDLESVALKTGLHLVPDDVFESVMTIHGIQKTAEAATGDSFVAWRAEFSGDAEATLARIGLEMLEAYRCRQIAEYSIGELRRQANEIREAAAERNMIGMDT